MTYKKGDYVYYTNWVGNTYLTQIYKVGRSGGYRSYVLIGVINRKDGNGYKRWVPKKYVRLQVREGGLNV